MNTFDAKFWRTLTFLMIILYILMAILCCVDRDDLNKVVEQKDKIIQEQAAELMRHKIEDELIKSLLKDLRDSQEAPIHWSSGDHVDLEKVNEK